MHRRCCTKRHARVFAEWGYGATTREIAARAGVSHDLVFRYFDTKESLFFQTVVAPLLDEVDRMRQNWLDHPDWQNVGHDQMIERFTTVYYEFMLANQAIARAMAHLFVGDATDPGLQPLRARISDTLAPMVEPLGSYLDGQDLRHSSPALQLRLMLLLIGATATFLPGTYRVDADVPSSAEIVDELSRFMANGLRHKVEEDDDEDGVSSLNWTE